MADAQKTFRDILGINKASPQTQTLANIIGGALFGGGLYGSLQAQPRSYETYTRDIQNRFGQIGVDYEKRTQAQEKQFAADLAGYQQGQVAGTAEGLEARGITDSKVKAEAKSKTESGISGAYAAAKAALARAKLNASSTLDRARANYLTDLANKQYESMVANYRAKAGLYGALGGLGAGLLFAPENPDQKAKKGPGNTIMSNNPKMDIRRPV